MLGIKKKTSKVDMFGFEPTIEEFTVRIHREILSDLTKDGVPKEVVQEWVDQY